MIRAIFNYQFMQNAFMAAFFSSILCGIVGTIVVEKKMVMMGGGLAHASFGGIGLGYFLGIEPIISALGFSSLSGLLMVRLKKGDKANLDTLIGIFWALGMALGILLIAMMPGYPPDMSSYLFGDILTVSTFYLGLMGAVTLVIVLVVSMWHHLWVIYLFDEEFAKVRKINIALLENILFVCIAISIVVLLKVVGMILVVALLTIPTAMASFGAKSIKGQMGYAVLLSLVFCIGGLVASYYLNIPSGASIILLSSACYFIQRIWLSQRAKKRRGKIK